MRNRSAVGALVFGSFLAGSSIAFANLDVSLATQNVFGDVDVLNGVYDSSDSGPLVDLSVSGPGSIGPQTSSGGSSASTGPYSLSYNATSISGSASSSATVVPSGASAVAQGNIELYFTVDQETPFTLTSALAAGGGCLALSYVYIGDTNIVSQYYGQIVSDQLNSGSNTFHDTGSFVPGDTYLFEAGASSSTDTSFPSDYSANASFGFDLELPEPSVVSALGLGSLMLLVRFRRRAAVASHGAVRA